MLSIAGCPGLVPGWRAFPAISRVSTNPSAGPFSPQSRHAGTEAKKDRRRGARWQSRIVAVYRAPPRHKTHRSEFRLARKLRGVLWLEHEENGEQREGTGVVVRRQSDGVAGLRIDPGDYRLRRVPQGSFLFAGAFWAIDPRRGFFCSPASD